MRRPTRQSCLRFPISNILGSYNHVRVMRELARHGGELTTSEISRRSGVAVQNVRTVLDSLVDAQVVTEIGSCRAWLYRIQNSHPVAVAIKALFEAEAARFSAVLQSVRDAAAGLDQEVLAVWLYGSVARGEDVPGSDVDIGVVTCPEANDSAITRLRERLAAAGERLFFTASVVGLDTEDVKRLNVSRDAWWINLTREALPLIGPDPQTMASRLERD